MKKFIVLWENSNSSKGICQFELNTSFLSLDNNNISDLSSLNNDTFKNIKQLYLGHNNINDLKHLCNLKFKNLIEFRINNNKITDINSLEYLTMNKIEKL